MSRNRRPKTRGAGAREIPTAPAAAPAGPVPSARTTNLLLLGATVVVTATVAAEVWITGSRTGLPLDDAFIHLRFAENLAAGEPFAFNPGENLPGTTSPLWVLLLSIPALFGANLVVAAKLLSAVGFVAMGLGAGRLAQRLTMRDDLALVAGLAALLCGRLVWAAASGMETTAFAAVSLFAIERAAAREEAQSRGGDIALGVLFGCAALLRPEGVLLFAVWLSVATTRREPPRFRLPPLWTVGAFAALVAPWIAFCVATTGHPLPTTFEAKRALLGREPAWRFFALHLQELVESNPLLGALYVVGLVLAARAALRDARWRIVVLWALVLVVAAAILLPVRYHHGRYLMPLLPVELLLGAWALAWLLGKLPLVDKARRPVARVALLVVLGTGAYGAVRFAMMLGANVAEIGELHARMGAWANRRTPEDALIAANDIGALGYLGKRRILDLGGIVTPEVAPLIAARRLGGEQDAPLFAVLARRRPDYLVVFPDWYPHLTARPDLFEPVAAASSKTQTISGGRLLVAYRARWDRFTPAPPLPLAEASARLQAARAAVRDGRVAPASAQIDELEARGPLDRPWRRLLYVARAEAKLALGDCLGARRALLHLDWLSPPEAFRQREAVPALEARVRACSAPSAR